MSEKGLIPPAQVIDWQRFSLGWQDAVLWAAAVADEAHITAQALIREQ